MKRNRASKPFASAGFTLMETLVMLLLTALTTSLMYQMLGNYRITGERVGVQVQLTRERALVEAWLRSSLGGLQADLDFPFEGGAAQLRGLTLNPLLGASGAGERMAWRMNLEPGGVELIYEQAGVTRFALPLGPEPLFRFVYLDAEGQEHERWPPAKGLYPQLPEAILIYRGATSASLQWIVALQAVKNPEPFTPIEIELGE